MEQTIFSKQISFLAIWLYISIYIIIEQNTAAAAAVAAAASQPAQSAARRALSYDYIMLWNILSYRTQRGADRLDRSAAKASRRSRPRQTALTEV